MPKYKALKAFHHGIGKDISHVQKGHVVEIDESYAEDHLEPHGLVEETEEPLTSEVRKEKSKAAKEEKKGKKSKAEEKAEAKEKGKDKD